MDFQQARIFLEKFAAGSHTAQEHNAFIDWLKTAPMDQVQALADEYRLITESRQPSVNVHPALAAGIEAAIDQYESAKQPPANHPVLVKMKRPFLQRMAAAVVILLVLSAGMLYWRGRSSKPQNGAGTSLAMIQHDALPGGNRATLLLSNGKTIILDSAANGAIASQENVTVSKQDAQISYTGPAAGNPVQALSYNTVTTPRGGQFRVVLPDGSKVWLNAASSLRFPTAFTGNERNVELSGEAYFEVAQKPARPFKVKKKNSDVEVQVLGTHFNVNTYDDEDDTKITLLEGSIKVSRLPSPVSRLTSPVSRILLPGQQASISSTSPAIPVQSDADIDEAVAWKNGLFQFSHTNISSLMKQVARWYDVDIVYEGDVMNEYFSGTVPRATNASSLFRVLELTKTVSFTIENKKIIVRPYKKT